MSKLSLDETLAPGGAVTQTPIRGRRVLLWLEYEPTAVGSAQLELELIPGLWVPVGPAATETLTELMRATSDRAQMNWRVSTNTTTAGVRVVMVVSER